MSLQIHAEKPADRGAVRAVNEAAFETAAEAGLVDALREQAQPLISLVAEQGGEIAGHILFSPVAIADYPQLKIMGLAPMAVLPSYQRRGLGSALVRAGLRACVELGYGAVVVLGHADYYPRFGFKPAAEFAIDCEYDVAPEAFMALELEPGYLRDVSGTVQYYAVFAGL